MANENFTTYIEVDPGDDITRTTTRVTSTNLVRASDSYVYKDFGVDYFSGDFIHQFELNITGTAVQVLWGMGNTVGSLQDMIDDNGDQLALITVNRILRVRVYESGSLTEEIVTSEALDIGVTYFVTVQREDAINMTFMIVRSGSHTGSVQSMCAVGTSSAFDYRYLYPCQTMGAGAGTMTICFTQNLDIDVALPPTIGTNEDFSTYTEVAPNADVALAPQVLVCNSIDRTSDTYVYVDKEVDHFSGDFIHQFVLGFSDPTGLEAFDSWGVSNTIGSTTEILTASGDLTHVRMGSDSKLDLEIYESGILEDSDTGQTISIGRSYFLTVIRNYSAKTYTLYIRTGSHEGTLLDTYVAIGATAIDFRYLYALSTIGDGSAGTVDILVIDLNLNEAADYFSKINTVLYTNIGKISTVLKSTIGKINNIAVQA